MSRSRFERLPGLALMLLVFWAFPPVGRAVMFYDLGDGTLPGKVSADGAVVVGRDDYRNQAFRWTAAGGLVLLPDFETGASGPVFGASGVSADGSIVVGTGHGGAGEEGFIWNAISGTVGLGFLPGAASETSDAFDVSADGSVVVGSATGPTHDIGFRWTSAGGMVPLDLPAGATDSSALAVSGDGSVIVGTINTEGSGSYNGTQRAFRWTSETGTVILGVLPNSDPSTISAAWGVSSDGTVIFGNSGTYYTPIAFRWTSAEGMVALGPLPAGFSTSYANAASSDGSVIVGEVMDGDISDAFRWDALHGMQPLTGLLTRSGVDLTGWILFGATSVSGDGTTICGEGSYLGITRAWVATGVVPDLTPTPTPTTTVAPTPPQVTVLHLPASGKRLFTTRPVYSLRGVVTADATAIHYRVGGGKWVVIAVSGNWQAKAKLKPGRNVITVIATGPGGDSKPFVLVIVRHGLR